MLPVMLTDGPVGAGLGLLGDVRGEEREEGEGQHEARVHQHVRLKEAPTQRPLHAEMKAMSLT